ncbi:DUF3950 domain-containing protein [Salmonella enterica subsp. enterica serovar Fulica]|nr:DUF3950 domain-containing protein [Salmonella enterica subsp. enterica serovar Fulica]
MPAKPRTSKTVTKNIRFSYSMLEQIEFALKSEKTRNFSAWVKEACRKSYVTRDISCSYRLM